MSAKIILERIKGHIEANTLIPSGSLYSIVRCLNHAPSALLNFEIAFDSINWESIQNFVRERGTQEKLTTTIRVIYDGAKYPSQSNQPVVEDQIGQHLQLFLYIPQFYRGGWQQSASMFILTFSPVHYQSKGSEFYGYRVIFSLGYGTLAY